MFFPLSFLLLSPAMAQPPCGGYVGITEGHQVYLCAGDTITLHASGFMVEYPLIWSTGHAGSEMEVTAPGIYSVRGNDYCGYDWIEVLPLDAAASPFSVSDALCPGGLLSLSTHVAEASFVWSDGSTAHPRNVTAPGVYAVDANTAGCGVLHFDFIVTTFDTSTVWLPPLLLCSGESLVIPCICSPPEPWMVIYGCRWNDGGLRDSFQVTSPGVVKMESQYPCEKVYYQEVVADPTCFTLTECLPQLPNVITPNGDGVNEQFKDFSGCSFERWDLQVYDLWGNRLFQSTDSKAWWEGAASKAAGVYVYRLEYAVEGKTHGDSGTLTLMR